jgi:hypothetical protein
MRFLFTNISFLIWSMFIGDFTQKPKGDTLKGERRTPIRHGDNLRPEGKDLILLEILGKKLK